MWLLSLKKKILDHVSMIDRAETSEAVQYLRKCLAENFTKARPEASADGASSANQVCKAVFHIFCMM